MDDLEYAPFFNERSGRWEVRPGGVVTQFQIAGFSVQEYGEEGARLRAHSYALHMNECPDHRPGCWDFEGDAFWASSPLPS